METIASFKVDHIRLMPGLYVSRKDRKNGITVTTFDMRITMPNREPVMDMPAVHTIEHLGATFMRNSSVKKDVVYFGPMGCRTGFYMLLAGDYSSREIAPLVTEMFEFIRDFRGEIPGAAPRDCGNWQDQNLGMANWLADRYLTRTLIGIDEKHLVYPE